MSDDDNNDSVNNHNNALNEESSDDISNDSVDNNSILDESDNSINISDDLEKTTPRKVKKLKGKNKMMNKAGRTQSTRSSPTGPVTRSQTTKSSPTSAPPIKKTKSPNQIRVKVQKRRKEFAIPLFNSSKRAKVFRINQILLLIFRYFLETKLNNNKNIKFQITIGDLEEFTQGEILLLLYSTLFLIVLT